jgi:KDO2-lipid IV(A) lauroyltransferase
MGVKSPAWAQLPIYALIRLVMAVPQVAGPDASLRLARRAGRWFGCRKFNRKRIERAADTIQQAFPEWDRDKATDYAYRSYEHLFQLAVETTFLQRLMTEEGWIRHAEVDHVTDALRELAHPKPLVLITAHAGNWELLGYTMGLLGYPMHVVYRPLDLKPLDEWVHKTRGRRGIHLIDKFGALRLLPPLMEANKPVAFTADQNAGDRGLFVPFFGRLTSTYKSIGMLAMQYDATVVCGYARRLHQYGRNEAPVAGEGFSVASDAPFRYRIEIVDTIHPEDWKMQPDPLFYVTARYRRAIQTMVEQVPEQFLWMHRIWKSRPRHERLNKPFPDRLRDKLASLPWMTEEELDRLVERSDRDRAFLTEHGLKRMP